MPKKNQRRNVPVTGKQEKRDAGRNPLAVIAEFCENYHLPEAQDMLWEWLVTALGKSPSLYDTGKERSNLFFFYENIEEILKAVYALNAQRVSNKTSSAKPAPPKESDQ